MKKTERKYISNFDNHDSVLEHIDSSFSTLQKTKKVYTQRKSDKNEHADVRSRKTAPIDGCVGNKLPRQRPEIIETQELRTFQQNRNTNTSTKTPKTTRTRVCKIVLLRNQKVRVHPRPAHQGLCIHRLLWSEAETNHDKKHAAPFPQLRTQYLAYSVTGKGQSELSEDATFP